MNYINADLVLWPSKMRVESNVISVLHSSNKEENIETFSFSKEQHHVTIRNRIICLKQLQVDQEAPKGLYQHHGSHRRRYGLIPHYPSCSSFKILMLKSIAAALRAQSITKLPLKDTPFIDVF